MKSSAGLLLSGIELDRASAIPLYRQLYLQIRKQILGGRIQGGVRLPSTRTYGPGDVIKIPVSLVLANAV